MGWGLGFAGLGIAGQLGFMYLLWATGWMNRLGGWVIPVGGVPFVIAMFTYWRIYLRLNRERVAGVARCLDGLGFRVTEAPSDAAKIDFCTPIAHLVPYLDLGPGAVGVQWCAIQNTISQTKALLFEHRYQTGSGKSTVEWTRTLLAWPAGHPDISNAVLPQLAWFTMARYPRFFRRLQKDELKDAAFAELASDWCLKHDAATARQFLSPAVRAELLRSPRGEAWYIGAGWVCCSFQGTLDGENADRFISHGRAVMAAPRA